MEHDSDITSVGTFNCFNKKDQCSVATSSHSKFPKQTNLGAVVVGHRQTPPGSWFHAILHLLWSYEKSPKDQLVSGCFGFAFSESCPAKWQGLLLWFVEKPQAALCNHLWNLGRVRFRWRTNSANKIKASNITSMKVEHLHTSTDIYQKHAPRMRCSRHSVAKFSLRVLQKKSRLFAMVPLANWWKTCAAASTASLGRREWPNDHPTSRASQATSICIFSA